jgi:hypothetical protein
MSPWFPQPPPNNRSVTYIRMNHPKNIPWVARDTGIKFWPRFSKPVPGGANKTQIVYEFGLNFHAVVPYLELITRNGLAEDQRRSVQI